MTALNLKLWRDLWHLRMQMLSIGLVVATAIMAVVTMRGSYVSLIQARSDYYVQMRFADAWAPLVRAPQGIAQRVAGLPGVQLVATRISFLATLDIPGLEMPAQGRFVSLPVFGRAGLNDVQVLSGRYLASGALDEVLISEKFAEARALGPGDSLKVIINGRSRKLAIVGVASSPEFSYAVPPGTLLPEYDRYGVFWMSQGFLGPAYDMDGAFNELLLRLDSSANPQAVLQQADAILDPYGGLGSYLRKDQLSHFVLENELAEIRVLGTLIPAIFMAVAVFLLHQVMGRLIATQRAEIAVMKAFGYTNRETGLHYLGFAGLAVLGGAVVGAVGGIWLGDGLIGIYTQYFTIPGLHYRPTFSLIALAVLATVIGASTGACAAIRRAVALPPAEAMRPEAPARFKPGPLEKLGVGLLLNAAGRMVLRNLERRPLPALFAVLGMAMSMAILVVGMFMFDSISYLIDMQFRIIQREDIDLTFHKSVSESVRFELGKLPGVMRVETYRQAPARLRAGHLKKEIVVTGLDPDSQLRRVVDRQGRPRPFPVNGMVLSDLLARNLGVHKGDTLEVEWLDGKRLQSRVRVTGTGEDFVGLSAYMSKTAMNAATGDSHLASGAYLLADEQARDSLFRQLKATPGIAGVSSPETMIASFEAEMAGSLTTSSVFLLGFAGIIAFGVIYNSARIALSERGRELASLRVMGFHRREVATLLLGEQLLITLLALPVGAGIGYGFARMISSAMESDSYRIPFIAEPRTYLLAALIILLAAVFSTFAVRRRLDAMNLVSVLKTRE